MYMAAASMQSDQGRPPQCGRSASPAKPEIHHDFGVMRHTGIIEVKTFFRVWGVSRSETSTRKSGGGLGR